MAVLTLAGCRDPYEEARQDCATKYPKTVDYIQCVNQVNAQEASDNDDAAMISTTIMLSSMTAVQ